MSAPAKVDPRQRFVEKQLAKGHDVFVRENIVHGTIHSTSPATSFSTVADFRQWCQALVVRDTTKAALEEILSDPASPHFMAALFAREGDGSASLFELKRLAECLAPGSQATLTAPLPYEHPERSVNIEPIGRLFELHPSLGLDGRAAILDIDLAALQRLQPSNIKFAALRRFPTSAFDVSVITPLREPVSTIKTTIRQAAGTHLVSVEFVGKYTGPPLPDDRKSVSYRVTLGANDRTLSAEEASASRLTIIAALNLEGYELRI